MQTFFLLILPSSSSSDLHELHAGGKPHMAASEHVEQERPGLFLVELTYRCQVASNPFLGFITPVTCTTFNFQVSLRMHCVQS